MSADSIAFASRHAYRSALFRRYVALKRAARDSDDEADHRGVAQAYTAYLRSHLAYDERTQLELEDEIARLRAEIQTLRQSTVGEAA